MDHYYGQCDTRPSCLQGYMDSQISPSLTSSPISQITHLPIHHTLTYTQSVYLGTKPTPSHSNYFFSVQTHHSVFTQDLTKHRTICLSSSLVELFIYWEQHTMVERDQKIANASQRRNTSHHFRNSARRFWITWSKS